MLEKEFDFFKTKEKKKFFSGERLEKAFIISIPILIFLRIILAEIYLQPAQLTVVPDEITYIQTTQEQTEKQLDAQFPNTSVAYKNVPVVDSFNGFVKNNGYTQEYLNSLSKP